MRMDLEPSHGGATRQDGASHLKPPLRRLAVAYANRHLLPNCFSSLSPCVWYANLPAQFPPLTSPSTPSLPVSPQAGSVSRCARKPKAQLQTSIIMMLRLVRAKSVSGVQYPCLLANNPWEKGQKNKHMCGMVDDYTTTLCFFFPLQELIKTVCRFSIALLPLMRTMMGKPSCSWCAFATLFTLWCKSDRIIGFLLVRHHQPVQPFEIWKLEC